MSSLVRSHTGLCRPATPLVPVQSFTSKALRPVTFTPLSESTKIASIGRMNLTSLRKGFMTVRAASITEATRTTAQRKVDENLLHFVKYEGLGNDFLLVDNRSSSTTLITPEQAAKLCNRNFGVGGDGVIFVLPGVNGSDYTMRIYNSDGSEPEMCGNGIRCMAKFVAELEGTTKAKSYNIGTLAGMIVPRLLDDGQVCVDMGPPTLESKKIPTTLPPTENGAVVKAPLEVAGRTWNVTCVSMGNPHCVVLLDADEDVKSVPLAEIGPLFEKNEVFPARTNTDAWIGKNMILVIDEGPVSYQVTDAKVSKLNLQKTYVKRGPTLACGTGACALVVAAVLEKRAERKCLVELPGGPLEIEWRESDDHVLMTGPAQIVFRGAAYV